MGKRRVQEEEESDIDVSSTESEREVEEGEEEEIVNVDFDYFDLNPDVDFHAIKTFLKQLFGDDCNRFDISSLADLILKENSVGTTIKTDGKESDPFALLSVLNIHENIDKASVKTVIDYVLDKTKKDTEFNIMLSKLLGKSGDRKQKVGLIVSERMLNMPVEVVPPMYKMLAEEMEKHEQAHERYEFDFFLVLSKVYQLVAPTVELEEQTKTKKKKLPEGEEPPVELDYFHYEDLVFEKHAKKFAYYNYTDTRQEPDSRRVFTEYGIIPKLSVILLDKNAMKKSIAEMEEMFPPF